MNYEPIESNNLTNECFISQELPDYVDLDRWSIQEYQWQGNVQLNRFTRLTEFSSQGDSSIAYLSFTTKQKGGVYWFNFVLTVELDTQCQRCLQLMNLPIELDIKLAILENEEQSGLLKEDDEWVLIEDVAEHVGKEIRLPILTVIEDELLLAVPMSPRHPINDEGCVPVDIIDDEDDSEAYADDKENPFAVLAGLKDQLKK